MVSFTYSTVWFIIFSLCSDGIADTGPNAVLV